MAAEFRVWFIWLEEHATTHGSKALDCEPEAIKLQPRTYVPYQKATWDMPTLGVHTCWGGAYRKECINNKHMYIYIYTYSISDSTFGFPYSRESHAYLSSRSEFSS